MPCGPRARLTAYVAYQSLTFAEREVLLAALAEAGYTHVETAPAGTDASNPLPVLDASRRIVGRGALVVRREHLPGRFGDLGFVLREAAYVPLVPSEASAERVLRELRAAYGRAKATQLAEQARLRYHASVQRTVSHDGTVSIRIRF